LLVFLISIGISTNKAIGQCGTTLCSVCNVTATITSISGGTIVNGTSTVGAAVNPGATGTGDQPLAINVTDCGVLSLSVELDFDWTQGSNFNWIHGISFANSGGWIAAQGTINPPDPGWLFVNSITGVCSGNTYDAGFYWDPPGTTCNQNQSSYNGTSCVGTTQCEANDPFLMDGDPSDNWGVNCTTDCPRFGFNLEYCPNATGTLTESISFVLTEDGETGGWRLTSGCIFQLDFPIEFQSAGVQIPAEQDLCLGESVVLDAGPGCGSYLWSTGETTQTIEVSPTTTTDYTVSVNENLGCAIMATTTVNVICCNENAGMIATNTPVCPGEAITYAVTGFNSAMNFASTYFVTDAAGVILEILPSAMGSYNSADCGDFNIYSLNYNTLDPTVVQPVVGMNVSTINCMNACCDLVSQLVSFVDTTAPTFPGAPMNLTIACPSLLPPLVAIDWMDDCAGMGMVAGTETAAPPVCSGGTITRTWEYTDDCGNVGTHMQVITISPPDPPTINCPGNVIVGCLTEVVPSATAASTSCGLGFVTATSLPSLVSGTAGCDGAVYAIQYTVTDDCNQSASCTQTFTINMAPPTIICPANTVVNCLADVVAGTPTVTSACGSGTTISSTAPTLISGAAGCDGSIYEISYTVTDDCGATDNCSQRFTLNIPPPKISCPADQTVNCVDDIVAGVSGPATDCALGFTVASSAPVLISGTAECDGAVYGITFTVTDECNATGTCVQSFTLNVGAPTITCPADQTVSCLADIAPGVATTTTECGQMASVATAGPSLLTGTAGCDAATYEIVYTVTDDCGTTASCSQTFTLDVPLPTIVCPADATVSCLSDISAGVATTSTSCAAGSTVATTGPTLATGTAECDMSTYEIVYTVTDDCGATASCTQTFTLDVAAPTIVCPVDMTVSCLADVIAGTPTATVSCGLMSTVSSAGSLVSGTAGCDGCMSSK